MKLENWTNNTWNHLVLLLFALVLSGPIKWAKKCTGGMGQKFRIPPPLTNLRCNAWYQAILLQNSPAARGKSSNILGVNMILEIIYEIRIFF